MNDFKNGPYEKKKKRNNFQLEISKVIGKYRQYG